MPKNPSVQEELPSAPGPAAAAEQDTPASFSPDGEEPVIEILPPEEDFSLADEDIPEELEAEEDGSNLPALIMEHLPSVPVRDSLQAYISSISKFPMLEPEEEASLARRVRDFGDEKAAFRLVSSHLRLVVRIALDFQRRWMQNVLDLIQEGNVGLLRAVNKFDPDKGIKFSYYASFWIRAYILKFIMDNWRMVKIGTTQAQRKLFYNLNKERQKLLLQGYDPDAAQLSQRLGVSEEQVVEMEQRLGSSDVSLDVPVSDSSGSATRLDYLPAADAAAEQLLADTELSGIVQASLEKIIPLLSEKELYILRNRLLSDEPMTLREIGDHYQVTRERIRQVEVRLLEKLKLHLKADIKDLSSDWIQE